MKILVKVLKVEEGFTHYQEIDRKTGKAMIKDYMETDRFITALESDFGFQLVKMNKKQAIDTASKFGAIITEWCYMGSSYLGYEATVSTKNEYTTKLGYTHKSVGISGQTQAQLCERAIVIHHTYKG